MSSTTQQELQAFIEENLKLHENLKKFFKQHEESKTFVIIKKNEVQEFLQEQETLIKNFNQRIDNITLITTKVIDDLSVRSLFTSGENVNKRLTSGENESHSRPSKKPRMEPTNVIHSHLGDFINIPGLQHLAENIFFNLKKEKLEDCRLINESAKEILDDPTFWLKKFVRRGLSKENQIKWMEAIQLTKTTNFEESVLLYLRESSKYERLVDLPCYIDEDSLAKSSAYIEIFGQSKALGNLKILTKGEVEDYIPGCIQILAPIAKYQGKMTTDIMTKNITNALWVSMHTAGSGNLKLFSALVPMSENINDLCSGYWNRQIQFAAMTGQLESIKILVQFADNLNQSSDGDWYTPIKLAMRNGHENVANYLKSYMENLGKPLLHG